MLEHEVYQRLSNSTSLAFSAGELKTKESDKNTGFSVRVLEGGRIGFAYTQAQSDLGSILDNAKKISRYSVKSGFSFAPKSSLPEVDIYDPELDPANYELLRTFVAQAKDAASVKGGNPRVISSIESSTTKIENTAGFAGEYQKTNFSIYVECMNGDGFGFAYLSSNHLPKDVSSYGTKASDMALAMQGAAKPPAGVYTIIMEIEALDSLFDILLPSFSGDWKRRSITKLAKGSNMFSEMLTISEDGTAKGVMQRPFDDEGTSSGRKVLVDKGAINEFLYDRETAALASVQESGCCSRDSYDSPPAISWSNIVIDPGSWKNLGDIEKYIEVHYAHGSHTANVTSGDFGLEASSAFLVEKGKRKPVKGFMISGNIFEFFSNIEAIESQQKGYGQLISPRIAFKNVRIVS